MHPSYGHNDFHHQKILYHLEQPSPCPFSSLPSSVVCWASLPQQYHPLVSVSIEKHNLQPKSNTQSFKQNNIDYPYDEYKKTMSNHKIIPTHLLFCWSKMKTIKTCLIEKTIQHIHKKRIIGWRNKLNVAIMTRAFS